MKKSILLFVVIITMCFRAFSTDLVTNVPTLLLSDCESVMNTSIGTYWYGYNDNNDGGTSSFTIDMTAVGSNGSGSAVNFTYTLGKGTLTYNPFVGFGFAFNIDAVSPMNLTPYTGFSFYHKGSACGVELETTNVTDYDNFNAAVPAHNVWTLVTIPWASFRQFGWGKKKTFDPALIYTFHVAVHGANGAKGTINLDDIKVLGTETGVKNVFETVKVDAFPNPFTTSFNVIAKEVMKSVVVRDLAGKQLLKQIVDSDNANIKASNLSTGMYLIDVEFVNGNRQTLKVSKK